MDRAQRIYADHMRVYTAQEQARETYAIKADPTSRHDRDKEREE
jgi:hypothetical protein